MKKRIVLMIAAVLCSLLIGACSSDVPDELKIAVVFTGDNAWNRSYETAISKYCAEYGWTYEVFASQSDPEVQKKQIQSILVQGFHAMIIQPADEEALAPLIGQASDAGIIVIGHHDFSDEYGINEKIYKVLFSQRDSTGFQAEQYVEQCGGTGKVAIIAGLVGTQNASDGIAGTMEVLGAHPDIEVVDTQYCASNTQKAQYAAQRILEQHPDLKAFLVQDDIMAMGVWHAVEAFGMQEEVTIVSQNFNVRAVGYLKQERILFSITYSAEHYARDAVETIKNVISGNNVPHVVHGTGELVTALNADEAAHN